MKKPHRNKAMPTPDDAPGHRARKGRCRRRVLLDAAGLSSSSGSSPSGYIRTDRLLTATAGPWSPPRHCVVRYEEPAPPKGDADAE
jgi:hypothetical protein